MIDYSILFHHLLQDSDKKKNIIAEIGEQLTTWVKPQEDEYEEELRRVFALWRWYEADTKEMEDYLRYRLNFLIKTHNRLSECQPKQQLKRRIAALKWVLQIT